MQFLLSLLLDATSSSSTPTVTGVNHLPVIRARRRRRRRPRAAARAARRRRRRAASRWRWTCPPDLGHEPISEGPDWTKGDLLRQQPGEARALHALRRAARRRRPPPRRVLPRLPHRGVGVGRALGRAPHRRSRSASGAGPPHRRRSSEMLARRRGVAMPSGEMVAPVDPVPRARPARLVPAQHPQRRPGAPTCPTT